MNDLLFAIGNEGAWGRIRLMPILLPRIEDMKPYELKTDVLLFEVEQCSVALKSSYPMMVQKKSANRIPELVKPEQPKFCQSGGLPNELSKSADPIIRLDHFK